MLHKISLEQIENTQSYKLLVDGVSLGHVAQKVKFEVTPCSIPVIEITYHGKFNYQGEAKAKFVIDDDLLQLASREDIQDIIDKTQQSVTG